MWTTACLIAALAAYVGVAVLEFNTYRKYFDHTIEEKAIEGDLDAKRALILVDGVRARQSPQSVYLAFAVCSLLWLPLWVWRRLAAKTP